MSVCRGLEENDIVVDFLFRQFSTCNVFCYICLSLGTECRGLKVSMKTTKTGVQRIKMNSQFMD